MHYGLVNWVLKRVIVGNMASCRSVNCYPRFGSFDIFLQGQKADSHIACRAHAVPLPCHAAKGLDCVFPI
jgi:hypothetical protein